MLYGENDMATNDATFKWSASDTATAAGGGTATLTFALQAWQQLCVAALYFSFSAAVTAGRLTIVDDGNTILDLDLGTGAGWWALPFPKIRKSSVGKTVTINLATGGGTGVPKLNAIQQTINA
jgi:hypothetical protein